MQRLSDSSCPWSDVLFALSSNFCHGYSKLQARAICYSMSTLGLPALSPFSHHHHHPHHFAYSSLRRFLGIQQAHDKPPTDSESYQQQNCFFHLSLYRKWDQLSRCILQAFPYELSKRAPVTPISGLVPWGRDWGLCCRSLPALTG